MAMVQNQWYHFGIGAPPILIYLSGDWDVHRGSLWVLTHGNHMFPRAFLRPGAAPLPGKLGGVQKKVGDNFLQETGPPVVPFYPFLVGRVPLLK